VADNLLITSLENAFVSLLAATAASFGANIYPGHSSADKALPAVIPSADGSSLEEDPPMFGNFWVDVELAVKARASTEPGALSDPNVADLALTAAIFNQVKVLNLDALLNAQGQNLTVFPRAYFFGSPKAGRDAQGVWVDILPMKIYCCASIIAP
jgi:hypothetical protein